MVVLRLLRNSLSDVYVLAHYFGKKVWKVAHIEPRVFGGMVYWLFGTFLAIFLTISLSTQWAILGYWGPALVVPVFVFFVWGGLVLFPSLALIIPRLDTEKWIVTNNGFTIEKMSREELENINPDYIWRYNNNRIVIQQEEGLPMPISRMQPAVWPSIEVAVQLDQRKAASVLRTENVGVRWKPISMAFVFGTIGIALFFGLAVISDANRVIA